MGKTAFALNIALNCFTKYFDDFIPARVVFVSLEMSRQQIIDRLLSIESDVFLSKITRANLTDIDIEKLKSASTSFGIRDIVIREAMGLKVEELKSLCVDTSTVRFGTRSTPDIIIIDYLQLLRTETNYGANKVAEVSEISRALKELAVNLKCPVVALSQLSREVEKRVEKVPRMSDLRDSGSIEQDADTITFIYRADYYEGDINEGKKDFYGHEIHEPVTAEFTVAKNRNGPLGNFKLLFTKECTKFLRLANPDSLIDDEDA